MTTFSSSCTINTIPVTSILSRPLETGEMTTFGSSRTSTTIPVTSILSSHPLEEAGEMTTFSSMSRTTSINIQVTVILSHPLEAGDMATGSSSPKSTTVPVISILSRPLETGEMAIFSSSSVTMVNWKWNSFEVGFPSFLTWRLVSNLETRFEDPFKTFHQSRQYNNAICAQSSFSCKVAHYLFSCHWFCWLLCILLAVQ